MEVAAAPRDPTAVIGRRIVAWVLDVVILMVLVGSVFAASAVSYENVIGADDPCAELDRRGVETDTCFYLDDQVYVASAGETTRAGLVGWGYAIVAFVLLQGLAGFTPGKVLMGLRVIDEAGARPGMGKATVRTVLWVIDGAPWCLPLVGFITGVTTQGHRRVGDMAAKTFVVGRADVGSPVVLADAPIPIRAPAPVGAWGATQPPVSPPVFPPTAPPAAGQVASTPAPAPSGSDEPRPIWDERWATWLIWDPPRERWLRWDAAAATWIPIS